MRLIHGPAASPFVRKACIFLNEKGLSFERRELDPLDKTPRFLGMNPMGRVPILEEEDGHLIPDSSVICDYLERLHPEPPLFPNDPRERARALWLEEFGDTHLVQVTASVYWMHVILPVRTGTPADPVEIQKFKDEHFPAVFDYFESQAPDGDTIVGNRFGIADIALAAPTRLLELAGDPLDATRWPRFAAYVARALDRPSARALRDAEAHATETFRTTGNAPPTEEPL